MERRGNPHTLANRGQTGPPRRTAFASICEQVKPLWLRNSPAIDISQRNWGQAPRGAGHHVHCPRTNGSRALERPREAPHLSQGEGIRNVTDAGCGIPRSIPMQRINAPASTQTGIENNVWGSSLGA